MNYLSLWIISRSSLSEKLSLSASLLLSCLNAARQVRHHTTHHNGAHASNGHVNNGRHNGRLVGSLLAERDSLRLPRESPRVEIARVISNDFEFCVWLRANSISRLRLLWVTAVSELAGVWVFFFLWVGNGEKSVCKCFFENSNSQNLEV